MTQKVRCSECNKIFDSMEDFKKHTCNPRTLGGAKDLRKGKEELHETEGGTGER